MRHSGSPLRAPSLTKLGPRCIGVREYRSIGAPSRKSQAKPAQEARAKLRWLALQHPAAGPGERPETGAALNPRRGPRALNETSSGCRAWIRTTTSGSKDPRATITPLGSRPPRCKLSNVHSVEAGSLRPAPFACAALSWCRRPGSNRHGSCLPTVFETVASTYSATSAQTKRPPVSCYLARTRQSSARAARERFAIGQESRRFQGLLINPSALSP